MKQYLIDDEPASANDIIRMARKYGYQGMEGFFFTSQAAQVLRDNGHTVSENNNFRQQPSGKSG